MEARERIAHLGDHDGTARHGHLSPSTGDRLERCLEVTPERLRSGVAPLLATIGEDDLQIVLDQLIENARSYGRPPIEVRLHVDASEVTLMIADRGPGLPPGAGDEILEPFQQGDEGLRRTVRGLGLGLAIVQRVVAAAGGRVDLDREREERVGLLITLPRVHADSDRPG